MIIARSARKRLQLEIACTSRVDSRNLVKEFGGRVEKWPRDWLRQFADLRKSRPLKIGKRLVIVGDGDSQTSLSRAKRLRMTRSAGFDVLPVPFLIIPASAAFGTGEHATTAMSLRLLERLTRKLENGWSLVDLGTGSGILALSAKRFGATRVLGIDVDPTAISIAKANAHLNKIDDADFQLADVRRWKPAAAWDVIAANLYSELLIEILPKLRRSKWLIFSGVLRKEENKLFVRVLQRNKIEIVKINSHGKWIAVLANSSSAQ